MQAYAEIRRGSSSSDSHESFMDHRDLRQSSSSSLLPQHRRENVHLSATMTQGTLSPRSPLPPSGSVSPVQITLLRGGPVEHQLTKS